MLHVEIDGLAKEHDRHAQHSRYHKDHLNVVLARVKYQAIVYRAVVI